MSKVVKDTYKVIGEAVDLICDTVASTLGPSGKNVLTVDAYGNAHLTKDGITVAKNVKSDDPVLNGIINVVREASANTAKTSGDGTTTSLVLTKALFDEGVNQIVNKRQNPTHIKEGMNEALNDVLKFIEEHSEKIDIESMKLADVAYISANNDIEVGDFALAAVREAGLNGAINIEESPTYDTYIKVTKGFTFDRGYISPHFTNNGIKLDYENALVFISEVELTKETVVSVLTFASKAQRPLIIIAPDFNEAIFMLLYKNYKAGVVNVCPIKSPGFAGNRKNNMGDMAVYVKGEVYKKNGNAVDGYFGNAERVLVNQDETSIINSEYNPLVENQINILKAYIESDPTSPMVELYEKRIAKLNGSFTTIYVGATTELELKEKKDRIEDAVCAVRTALRDGISEGGGMTFVRAFQEMQYKVFTAGYGVVVDCLCAPFKQLCKNSDLALDIPENEGYNFKTNTYEDLKKAGVVDPTLVLKNAITNSVGIASNLLTTAFITYVEA